MKNKTNQTKPSKKQTEVLPEIWGMPQGSQYWTPKQRMNYRYHGVSPTSADYAPVTVISSHRYK